MKYDRDRMLSLRVTPSTRERLDAAAMARGVSRHRIAVEALRAGLDAMGRELAPVTVEASR